MSDANVTNDEVAVRARALIEADVSARVNAVVAIAEAAKQNDVADARLKQAIKDAEAAHKESSNAHATAWKAALNAGWTEKELRATGVRAPGRSAPKARKRRDAPTVTDAPSE
ncbi:MULTISPECIES: hypothetical protein [unclassified Cryobacterium]|uniref:hypothetical protein n=1 Tax=unclassified Cryobacterium TaxID=2649013 RepID=UPI00106CCD78|nr:MULTISPECIES: hypothetical protein [unclassified Cryobacterium]TFC52839.1 hypothetical protein E3O68_13145 [Cryobacterium sp. TMB3-1-2]TFC62220.1 hypothetical protein E3O60_02745 [Cryobacterium sp. TMB1-7]TFC70689.1 hypothetical protein E3T21_09760 [Cryobacterium sp. TMB3-15]TFC75415.1 hypothetical protein E3T22_12330 [Cryobacterium sp. TMB3-10]TFD37617.1 hypothetical protein E3T58_18550 [Cryobacterium sp. TMB3-12]